MRGSRARGGGRGGGGALTRVPPDGQVFLLLDVEHQLEAVARAALQRGQHLPARPPRVEGVALAQAGEDLRGQGRTLSARRGDTWVTVALGGWRWEMGPCLPGTHQVGLGGAPRDLAWPQGRIPEPHRTHCRIPVPPVQDPSASSLCAQRRGWCTHPFPTGASVGLQMGLWGGHCCPHPSVVSSALLRPTSPAGLLPRVLLHGAQRPPWQRDGPSAAPARWDVGPQHLEGAHSPPCSGVTHSPQPAPA